ncbi:MAG: AAA family ATPase [bacterium]|nr:AAA family ATPase [bacterium]
MRICSFKCDKLYGYLNLSPSFNNDITFLTGINGSGKTSVIVAINALLTPAFQVLDQWEFKSLALEVEHSDKTHRIEASKDNENLILTVSSVSQPLKVAKPPRNLIDYPGADNQLEKYFEELNAKILNHPVIAQLRSFPTPMILGIDRRSQESPESSLIRRRLIRWRGRAFDIFRSTLSDSLREAVALAEQKYFEFEKKRTKLADKLRENIILSALEYSYSPELGLFELPTIKDSYALSNKLEDAVQTLKDLGIHEASVRKQLESFFSKLKEVMNRIPDGFDFGSTKDKEVIDTVVQWLINKPQFDRIDKILRFVDEYISQVKGIRNPLDQYQQAVNSFLGDSGKQLFFNPAGEVWIKIQKALNQPLSGLSSGESQLVVILTHLSFNPVVRNANVFIVDEPELSLHMKWQEAFVDAIQKTNPKLQIILATHSPSIILDRVDKCVDLSQGVAE